MTDAECAWLAGLLEGEGCFGIFWKTSTTGDPYPTFRITLKMCDEDVVRRAFATAGVGTMPQSFQSDNPEWSRVWTWNVNKRADVYSLCETLLPWMGDRRRAKMQLIMEMLATGRPEWRHGTRQGYERHKCKCAACTASNTKRHKERRAKLRAR